MIILNKNVDSDLILQEISEKSVSQYEYSNMSSEYIFNTLRIALHQQNNISFKNLSLYRFESLINIITFKKLMIERLENYKTEGNSIAELENQIEKYSKNAILLIREIITSNQINKMYN